MKLISAAMQYRPSRDFLFIVQRASPHCQFITKIITIYLEHDLQLFSNSIISSSQKIYFWINSLDFIPLCSPLLSLQVWHHILHLHKVKTSSSQKAFYSNSEDQFQLLDILSTRGSTNNVYSFTYENFLWILGIIQRPLSLRSNLLRILEMTTSTIFNCMICFFFLPSFVFNIFLRRIRGLNNVQPM